MKISLCIEGGSVFSNLYNYLHSDFMFERFISLSLSVCLSHLYIIFSLLCLYYTHCFSLSPSVCLSITPFLTLFHHKTGIGASVLFYVSDLAFNSEKDPLLVSHTKDSSGIEGTYVTRQRVLCVQY